MAHERSNDHRQGARRIGRVERRKASCNLGERDVPGRRYDIAGDVAGGFGGHVDGIGGTRRPGYHDYGALAAIFRFKSRDGSNVNSWPRRDCVSNPRFTRSSKSVREVS